MPTLIHLNGPPAIGKSTLAALYAERHPRTLNLDLDVLHPLVGGWQDPEQRTHDLLRPVALAMASAHLAGGNDVVLPQHLGSPAAVAAFEQVADERGADFREIVLLDDRAEAVARFARRRDDTIWGRHNDRLVAELGGPDFLGTLVDQLVEVLERRPSAVVVRSEAGAVESTYALLSAAMTPPAEVVRLRGHLVCRDEDQLEVVRSALPRHLELTRAEPGCLSFEVLPTGDPLVWLVDERFADADAFATHRDRTAGSDWGRRTVEIERRYAIDDC